MRAKNTAETEQKKRLTRSSVFTLLISPDFMRAANAAQSAAETPQLVASISSQSTSNFFLPNFTVGMEYVGAAAGPALRPGTIQ